MKVEIPISPRELDVCIATYEGANSLHAKAMRAALLELRQRRLVVGTAGRIYSQVTSDIVRPAIEELANGR